MAHEKLIIRRRSDMTSYNTKRLQRPLIICVLVILVAVIISQATGLSFETLSEDASMSSSRTWLTGALSTLGIILFAMAAGILFFAVSIRKRMGISKRNNPAFWLAVCSFLLLLDDAFQIHETLSSHVFNIPDWVIQIAIGQIIILTLIIFRSAIQSSFVFALPAIFCWAASVLIDLLSDQFALSLILLEDSLKLLGIFFWLQLAIDIGRRSLENAINSNAKLLEPS
ncbi:hypothetical protein [Zhongshania aliphaticivorans]|nr:hypothetical protein [Zhongshania aliphaticivorans]